MAAALFHGLVLLGVLLALQPSAAVAILVPAALVAIVFVELVLLTRSLMPRETALGEVEERKPPE